MSVSLQFVEANCTLIYISEMSQFGIEVASRESQLECGSKVEASFWHCMLRCYVARFTLEKCQTRSKSIGRHPRYGATEPSSHRQSDSEHEVTVRRLFLDLSVSFVGHQCSMWVNHVWTVSIFVQCHTVCVHTKLSVAVLSFNHMHDVWLKNWSRLISLLGIVKEEPYHLRILIVHLQRRSQAAGAVRVCARSQTVVNVHTPHRPHEDHES